MLDRKIKGRGSVTSPMNRFEKIEIEADSEYLEHIEGDLPKPKTEFWFDATQNILSKNDSPDIPFTYGLNPYRGCEHGCVYCYARPTHEYFGLSAGLDFETKILVKKDAPKLLEQTLRKPSWKPHVIALSGNTDCYQPAERHFRITRNCLKVLLKYRNPVGIISKNALVARDIDLLQKLAELQLVHVVISITTLDNRLSRIMEPRTAAPLNRLKTVRKLREAGIPTAVNIAPIIPGLTDMEIPAIAKAAAEAGAMTANCIVVRLPYSIKEMFQKWLETHMPDRADKVLNAIRSMRDGELNKKDFHERFIVKGPRGDVINSMMAQARKAYGLDKPMPKLRTDLFTRTPEQMQLF